MNELSTEKLAAIIEEGDFEALVDCVETDFFDCKGGVYICDSDISKRELAKDVGSFANLKGGYILIGPQTQKTETHPFDIINKISYSNRDLIDIDQYHKILKEWLYPEIDGLRIGKSAKQKKEKVCLLYIYPSRVRHRNLF
jgi:predicted HTH transcriptional regulator